MVDSSPRTSRKFLKLVVGLSLVSTALVEAENDVGKQSSVTFVNQNRQLKYIFMQNVALQKKCSLRVRGEAF